MTRKLKLNAKAFALGFALLLPLTTVGSAEAAGKPPAVTGTLTIAPSSTLVPQGQVDFDVTISGKTRSGWYHVVTLVCWDEPWYGGPTPPTGVWLQQSLSDEPHIFFLGDTEAVYDNWPDGAPAHCAADLTYREKRGSDILRLDSVSFEVIP